MQVQLQVFLSFLVISFISLYKRRNLSYCSQPPEGDSYALALSAALIIVLLFIISLCFVFIRTKLDTNK